MRVVFALALLGLFHLSAKAVAALGGLEPVRGPWSVRAMAWPEALGGPPPGGAAAATPWHWWRSDQGQYFLANVASTTGTFPARLWALESDPGGRACPRLKAQPPERLQEPELNPLPDEELALPARCLGGLEGQCLSHDGALRLRLSFDGQTRLAPAHAGRKAERLYTGRRRLVIEHVLSGVQAVFEEHLKDSPRYTVLGPASVVYLPELDSVVLQGLGPATGARREARLHCLPMP